MCCSVDGECLISSVSETSRCVWLLPVRLYWSVDFSVQRRCLPSTRTRVSQLVYLHTQLCIRYAYIMHTLLHARSRSSLVYTIQSTEWPRSLHSVKWIALSAPSPSLHTSYLSEELIILRDFSTLYIDDPGNIVLKYRRVMKAEDESAIRLSYDERYNANKSVRLICSQVYQGWILMIWMISRKRWNHIS